MSIEWIYRLYFSRREYIPYGEIWFCSIYFTIGINFLWEIKKLSFKQMSLFLYRPRLWARAVCGRIRCRTATKWMREQNPLSARQPACEHRRVLAAGLWSFCFVRISQKLPVLYSGTLLLFSFVLCKIQSDNRV